MLCAVNIHTVEALARTVYATCRDCQGEYRNLAKDVRNLQNSVQDVEDTTDSQQINPSEQLKLYELAQACHEVLIDLSGLVEKYNDLPLQSKRTWERLHWDPESAEIKERLISTSEQLVVFYEELRSSPTAQIERALTQLAVEVSKGCHEIATAASLNTITKPDDDSGWPEIVRDLTDMGVDQQIVEEHKPFVVDWVLRAINNGDISDEKIPVMPESIPTPHTSPPRPPEDPIPVSPTNFPIPMPRHPPPYLARPHQNQSHEHPGLRPIVSSNSLYEDYARDMDQPPSPMEQEPAESDIVWNAQRICHHWNRREWQQAQTNIEAQIASVTRGEYVEISGMRQQPEIRILKHILGVCHSFAGDFVEAKKAFESVMQGIYAPALVLDDGDIAAARWLAQTCLMMNQPGNAALAWSIAAHGMIGKPRIEDNSEYHFTCDALGHLYELNSQLDTLDRLKKSLSVGTDDTTILLSMTGASKLKVVTTVTQVFGKYNYWKSREEISTRITIKESCLTQPLINQFSWPFEQDPFFDYKRSIELAGALGWQRLGFLPEHVPSVSLGRSNTLVYVTKRPVQFLIEALRWALNTYAIEWKIRWQEYLLRLSQTHDNVAYYDCFLVQVRKLSLRNAYGFKVVDSRYHTRRFQSTLGSGNTDSAYLKVVEELKRKEKVRTEIAERLREYVERAEKDLAAGWWPPVVEVSPPYEVGLNHVLPPELAGRGQEWEMAGQEVVRKPVQAPSYEIVEMPA